MAKWLFAYVITLIIFPRVKPYLEDIIDNDYINDKNNNAVYIVDYAHTEYAMTLLLRYAKIKTSKSFLITVFGCGGNRDSKKRKIMLMTL